MKTISKPLKLITFSLVTSVLFFGFNKSDDSFKLPKSITKQFSLIPSGQVFNGDDTIRVSSFYMSNCEVSNAEYNEFLKSLKKDGQDIQYNIAKIDTGNWTTEFEKGGLNPFSNYYHSHEAFKTYPVVNVSIEGAKLYCAWLTNKLRAENDESEYEINVRLPSRNEWLRAATGKHKNSIYSWGGPYLRNAKGMFLCNFKSLGAENITFDQKTQSYSIKGFPYGAYMGVTGSLNDNADITSPVASYFQSDLGLYNMNGNVAELVAENLACGGSWNSTGYDVRNQSVVAYQKPSTEIGFRPIMVVTKK